MEDQTTLYGGQLDDPITVEEVVSRFKEMLGVKRVVGHPIVRLAWG